MRRPQRLPQAATDSEVRIPPAEEEREVRRSGPRNGVRTSPA